MTKVEKTKSKYVIKESGYISKEAQALADKLIAERKAKNKEKGKN